MHWLFAGIATIAAVEVMLRLPLASIVAEWQATARRAVHVVTTTRISDHWKEIAVPTYALRLLRLTARLAVRILVVVSPFVLAGVVSVLAGTSLLEFLSSTIGIVFTTLVAVSYAGLRFSGVRAGL